MMDGIDDRHAVEDCNVSLVLFCVRYTSCSFFSHVRLLEIYFLLLWEIKNSCLCR